MANYISMFQYSKDTFSVIHNINTEVHVNDSALVYHKTLLHAKNRATNELNIIEVIECRSHKTDPTKLISIVKCENQSIPETEKAEN